jgi:hypothetical protein
MKKLGFLLALAMALPLAASKYKHKDKHFDPVTMTASQAVGRYVGIDPDFVIEVTASGGTLRNAKRTATLTHIVFEGSEMRATAEYDAGRREPFQATFGNRVTNGVSFFGMLVHNVDLRIDDDIIIQDLFCRRM